MTKVLLIVLMFVAFECQASIFGSLFSKVDNKTSNAIENQTKKIGVIEGLIDEVKASVGNIDVSLQGQAGVGNKMIKTTKEMRDNINDIKTSIDITKTSIKQISKNVNQSNQAGIFYVGFIAQSIIIIVLVMCLGWIFAKSMERKKYVIKYEKELDDMREGRKVIK